MRVDRGDDARRCPEQGLHRVDHAGDGMRLEADDDDILRPEFGGIVSAARSRHLRLVADQELEPVGLHRRQMRAARDDRNLVAGGRESRREIAADGARAENGNFHPVIPSFAPSFS